MPITQGIGAFNVGRDCTLIVVDPAVGRVDIPNVTGFKSEQQTAAVKIDRLDGVQLHAELPKGWTFSFQADRGSVGLDVLFANKEAAWYNNGTVAVSTIYQIVQETDGSTTTFQYTQASLKMTDAGDWRGDQVVKQSVTGTAFRRQVV